MRKRSTGINIRVTPTEKRKMERRAKNTGLTLSEYLRQRALGYTPKFHPPPEFFSELVHLEALTEQIGKFAPEIAEAYRDGLEAIQEMVLWKGEDADSDNENMGCTGQSEAAGGLRRQS